jgi:hypothetical protein
MEPTPTLKAAPAESTLQDPAEQIASLELTKELIVSLSKEIDTTMTSIMAFRTKIGFGMFVGPFVLLGSFIVAAKGQPVPFNLSQSGRIALVVDLACYLAIGFIAAKIEAQAYDQCNKWRNLIWRLLNEPLREIEKKEFVVKHQAYWGYLGGFGLLFVSVVATVFIIVNSGTSASPNSAGTAPTYRIEQVSPTQH